MDRNIRPLSLACLLYTFIGISSLSFPAYAGEIKNYYPVYPEESKYAWVKTAKWGGPPFELRLRASTCFMGIKAYALGNQLVISWTHEELGKTCEIYPSSEPLFLEDISTKNRLEVNVFQRVFPALGPSLSLEEPVNLKELIPGFADVPDAKQKYTLSYRIKRVFKGKLPIESLIQLPDVWIDDQRIQLPELKLERYERSGDGWWYVPPDIKTQKTRPVELGLGGGTQVFKEADTWHKWSSVLRIAVSFRGDPFTYKEWSFSKNKSESEIYGEIFFEVVGNKSIHLGENRVMWMTQKDNSPQSIQIDKSSWLLKRFTTSNLSERLDYLQDSLKEDEKYNDGRRSFMIEVPNFNPRHLKVYIPKIRFKVHLPNTNPDGYVWKVHPIEFTER